MSEKYKFYENQIVAYNNGVVQGVGAVVGVATTSMPIIGNMYIVKDMSKLFPNATYPFSCFPIAECHLFKA